MSTTTSSLFLPFASPGECVQMDSHDNETFSLIDFTHRIKELMYCGGGGYSDVYKCSLSGSSMTVAVKSLRYLWHDRGRVERLKRVFQRELGIWRSLGNHPNIVPLLGVVRNLGPVDAPVSPWLSNGTLHSFIESRGNTLASREKIRMLEGIASGLAYLHSREIVHGDLTSSNILIDDHHNPRLIDFGLASSIGPLQPDDSYLIKISSTLGSLRWMAPELLLGGGLLPSADVYSFGCIMLEVLSGEIPFQGEGETRVIWLKVKENKLPDRPVCATLETRHWELMTQCWSNPLERPTACDALNQIAEFRMC